MPTPSDVLIVPSLYGNKSRMGPFIAAVTRSHVPEGGVVCDLMSGTGVASQALGTSYDVYANDANPYAALLTGWRRESLTPAIADAMLEGITGHYQQNMERLQTLFSSQLEQEAVSSWIDNPRITRGVQGAM